MFVQIALGSVLLVITVIFASLSFWLMEVVFARLHDWLLREPHRPKMMLVVVVASLWVLGIVTFGVWMWAFAFHLLGVFGTLEEAVYFALVSFTTLGYGDVLLPHAWRILGGMAAANGLLMMGLLMALLVEVLRQLRAGQVERRRKG